MSQPKSRNWSLKEDEDLLAVLDTLKSKGIDATWNEIAEMVRQRNHTTLKTGKQCRQRWCNQLNPEKKRDQFWSKQQNQILFRQQQRLGNKWSQISSKIPGRTDNCVKNHFYSTVRQGMRKVNSFIQNIKRKKCAAKIFKVQVLNKILTICEGKNDNRFQFKNSAKELASFIKVSLINLALEMSDADEQNLEFKEELYNNICEFLRNCRRKKTKRETDSEQSLSAQEKVEGMADISLILPIEVQSFQPVEKPCQIITMGEIGAPKGNLLDIGTTKGSLIDTGVAKNSQIDLGSKKGSFFQVGATKTSQIDMGIGKNPNLDLGIGRSTHLNLGVIKNIELDVGMGRNSSIEAGLSRSTHLDVGLSKLTKSTQLDLGIGKSTHLDLTKSSQLDLSSSRIEIGIPVSRCGMIQVGMGRSIIDLGIKKPSHQSELSSLPLQIINISQKQKLEDRSQSFQNVFMHSNPFSSVSQHDLFYFGGRNQDLNMLMRPASSFLNSLPEAIKVEDNSASRVKKKQSGGVGVINFMPMNEPAEQQNPNVEKSMSYFSQIIKSQQINRTNVYNYRQSHNSTIQGSGLFEFTSAQQYGPLTLCSFGPVWGIPESRAQLFSESQIKDSQENGKNMEK